MPISAKTFQAAIVGVSALLAGGAHAEGIDTEHVFGFMIGSDVGTVGEREFQSETTGRFARNGGNYRAVGQQLELEFLPAQNFRIEMGTSFAAHDINGVTGVVDRRQLSWRCVAVRLPPRCLHHAAGPFSPTPAAAPHPR